MPLTEEDIISRIDANSNGASDPVLGTSLKGAALRNPDQMAEIVQLSDSQSLPMETVERNTNEVKAQRIQGQLDPVEIKRNSPVTAEYLSDAKNATVSIDDIPVLRAMEKVLEPVTNLLTSNPMRKAGGRVAELAGNLLEMAARGMDLAHLSPLRIDMPEGFEPKSLFEALALSPPQLVAKAGEILSEDVDTGYVPDFTWEKLKGDITPTNLAGYIIETGPSSLVDMAFVIGSLPLYLASRTEEIAEARAANDQRTDVSPEDLIQGLVTATIVSLLERIGARSVFDLGIARTAKDVGVAAGEAFIKEGITEFVQEGIEYYGETLGTEKPINHLEALDRSLAGLVAGAPMGGGIRGSTATVQALATRVEKNTARTVQSMNEQVILDEIISLSQDSKTRERAQDRFETFLRAAGKDRVVYISAKDVLMLEDQGVELPRYITEQAVGDGDVEISMDRFASEIAPNEELMAALRPFVRLSSDTLTQTESEADDDTSLRLLMERTSASEDVKSETDAIWETVKDQLVATGRQGTETAKFSAMLIPAYAASKAEELGISPTEVFEAMNFTMVGPQAPDADVSLQATLPNADYKVARDAALTAAEGDQVEHNRLLDIDTQVGLGKMTNAEGVAAMRGGEVLEQTVTDEDGNVFEIKIDKGHVDKKINMVEELVRCMS